MICEFQKQYELDYADRRKDMNEKNASTALDNTTDDIQETRDDNGGDDARDLQEMVVLNSRSLSIVIDKPLPLSIACPNTLRYINLAVVQVFDWTSMLECAARSCSMTDTCPYWAATKIGVNPLHSARSMLIRATRRCFVADACPKRAAM
jgi:hypothetical protein